MSISKKELELYIHNILKKYWWYNDFRWNQKNAILDLLLNKNIVYLEKTGWGKSIVYQIPAILKKWLTIVVSPLKSLMKDQVESLNKKWVSATFINSDLDREEKYQRIEELKKWKYHMLYLSPEMLFYSSLTDELLEIPNWINYFILDEFDTVIEYWASWFRPEFLELWNIKKKLSKKFKKEIPVWIFTATASQKVVEFVSEMMWIKNNYNFYKWKLVWDNLNIEIHNFENVDIKDYNFYWYLETIKKEVEKDKSMCVIFCTTIKDVDSIYDVLHKWKLKVAKYHGRLDKKKREKAYEKFINNKINFIVSTNAFWRGIDKWNIRYIFHYWTPWNISAYMQEIWRWWRDWKDYKAILLYTLQDINRRKFLINCNSNSEEQMEEYNKFLDFLDNQNTCRIQNLYEYFWYDENEISQKCNKCDNCNPSNTLKNKKSKLYKIKQKINEEEKKKKEKRRIEKIKATKAKNKTKKRKSTSIRMEDMPF